MTPSGKQGFSSIQVMPDLNLTSSLYPVFSLTGDDLRFSISATLGFIVPLVRLYQRHLTSPCDYPQDSLNHARHARKGPSRTDRSLHHVYLGFDTQAFPGYSAAPNVETYFLIATCNSFRRHIGFAPLRCCDRICPLENGNAASLQNT